MQQPQIVVGVVKDDLDGWILEERSESSRFADGQRIDDSRLLARRELEQVNSVDEAVEARAFSVQRENGRVGDRRKERVDGAGRVEVDGRVCGSHAPNLNGIHF